jgi:hypothetical protein
MTIEEKMLCYFLGMLVLDDIMRDTLLRRKGYTPPERQLPAQAGRTTRLGLLQGKRVLVSLEGSLMSGTTACYLEVVYGR